MKFYVCKICGNVFELIDGDASRTKCCNNTITLLEANTVDASLEKHVPVYEVKDNEIEVKVGSIIHPMEEKHYIMWIALVKNNRIIRVNLKPGDEPIARFKYEKGSTIYAYCNLHGLWKSDVK